MTTGSPLWVYLKIYKGIYVFMYIYNNNKLGH